MRSWYHSWLAAIRIARRDAWRAKGRSLLVLAMLTLPIIGVSAADVTYRSSNLSTEAQLERQIGTADARVMDYDTGGEAVFQSPDNEETDRAKQYGENDELPTGPADITKALPAGAASLTDTYGSAKVHTKHGLLSTSVRELKSSDPMAGPIMPLLDGRYPTAPDEVAVTGLFLKNSGLKLGSTITVRQLERTYTIVGSYELPSELNTDQINALPGALLEPLRKALEKAELPSSTSSTSYLVKIDGGFTWNMVKEANQHGVTVTSRDVILDPPPDSEVPLFQKKGYQPGMTYQTMDEGALMVLATVVVMALLEICLLAGPAFAVGARRSRRQLGLVGANGGDRRHIRAIVLSGGLVLGAVAAVVGTVLGIALTYVARPWLEEYSGSRFDALELRPLELLGIALLAVLTGLAAALIPAVNASRQPVLASLTGRRGVRKSNRVLPTVGLIAVVLGAAAAFFGTTMSDGFLLIAGGSAIAELGVVAMTPALVGVFGRIGRFLPLSPRLALRDAVRNRGRTAPAVAAVLAAVAGTVAVATYAASMDAQSEAKYYPRLPYGTAALTLGSEGAAQHENAARAAVEKSFPVALRADVRRIAVGNPNCSVHGSYADNPGSCGESELLVPTANVCPIHAADPARPGESLEETFTAAERRKLVDSDWRCASRRGETYSEVNTLIGDASLLKVLKIDDPAAAKALAAGKAVVLDRRYLDAKNTIGIQLITDVAAANKAREKSQTPPGRVVKLPAYQLDSKAQGYGIQAIVPPAAAEAAKITTAPYGAYYTLDRLPRSEETQRLDAELARIGIEDFPFVESGFQSDNNVMMLALAVFAGLITIGAAGIATGLSQADAEADLKTLAAVGAPPRVRRTLSGFQCGVVAAMGVVLGSATGVVPAIGLVLADRRSQTTGWKESVAEGYADLADKP